MDTKRILVVDDEPQIRQIIKLLFGSRGYRVLEAADAEEAVRIIQDEPLDCILLDAMLPGASGAKLCRTLKKDPRFSSIPVIMLSGMLGDDDSEQYLREASSADAFVAKPFVLSDFLAKTERLLAASRS